MTTLTYELSNGMVVKSLEEAKNSGLSFVRRFDEYATDSINDTDPFKLICTKYDYIN